MTFLLTSEDEARAWIESLSGVSRETVADLEAYANMLIAESARQNLLAASTLDHVWTRHLVDSAQLWPLAADAPAGPWLDLGSGPGLPGLVLAILHRHRSVKLVESRALRVQFLRQVVDVLKLDHVEVIHASLEKVKPFPAAIITARAFAPLDKLLRLSAPFSTDATLWLLPKGKNAVNELSALPQTWHHTFHVVDSITDPLAGIIKGTLKR